MPETNTGVEMVTWVTNDFPTPPGPVLKEDTQHKMIPEGVTHARVNPGRGVHPSCRAPLTRAPG